MPDSAGKIAYTGVNRSELFHTCLTAVIYIINIDGSGQVKITDDETEAAKPMFFPDGRYLAFVGYIYDSRMEYILKSPR